MTDVVSATHKRQLKPGRSLTKWSIHSINYHNLFVMLNLTLNSSLITLLNSQPGRSHQPTTNQPLFCRHCSSSWPSHTSPPFQSMSPSLEIPLTTSTQPTTRKSSRNCCWRNSSWRRNFCWVKFAEWAAPSIATATFECTLRPPVLSQNVL